MTTLKYLDDIYRAAIKNWFAWEDKKYDEPKFYEGYKKLANKSSDDFYDYIFDDISVIEWVDEQLPDGIDVIIEKYPREVYSILQNHFGKDVVRAYFKEEGVKKEDVERKNRVFLDALYRLLMDKAVFDGEYWRNLALSDYAEFLQKKVNKFFGNKSLKGTRISAPQQMRKASPQRKRAAPKNRTPCVKVNVRRMF